MQFKVSVTKNAYSIQIILLCLDAMLVSLAVKQLLAFWTSIIKFSYVDWTNSMYFFRIYGRLTKKITTMTTTLYIQKFTSNSFWKFYYCEYCLITSLISS